MPKIDTRRMKSGDLAAARYLPQRSQGDPWFVILDDSGKTLASSVGPKGNIGYPYQPEESAYFVSMLREARQSISDAELETISVDLDSFRSRREQKLAEPKTK